MLANFVNENSDKFLTITFVKKDGTLRTINGRFGVTKHLRGGVKTVDPDKFFTIYSLADEGYRNINKESIVKIARNGVTIYNKNNG